jgi:hypothetical protein
MQPAPALDSLHRKEWRHMGKRVVATPPAHLRPQIATALGVTIDEMFGRAAQRKLAKQEGDSRLRRRLLVIEKLDVAEKRQVLQVIGAFIERGRLKCKAESRA